jgi:hypothetical protein
MIIVELMGGLGNQMFQYAFIRAMSIDTGVDFALDLSWFKTQSKREYCLDQWSVLEPFADPKDLGGLAHTGRNDFLGSIGRIISLWRARNRIQRVPEADYSNETFELDSSRSSYFSGFWQSPKFFQNHRDILLKEFQPRALLDGANLEMAEKIRSCDSVSLHVRRGDYVEDPATNQYHGTCDAPYYSRCVDRIRRHVEKPVFFIFSDDPAWCKDQFTDLGTVVVVDINDADHPHFDMYLMSLCKHNIIANSSFSWWGAWLNTNPDKIVLAPKRWFLGKTIDINTLLPNSWIAVE